MIDLAILRAWVRIPIPLNPTKTCLELTWKTSSIPRTKSIWLSLKKHWREFSNFLTLLQNFLTCQNKNKLRLNFEFYFLMTLWLSPHKIWQWGGGWGEVDKLRQLNQKSDIYRKILHLYWLLIGFLQRFQLNCRCISQNLSQMVE